MILLSLMNLFYLRIIIGLLDIISIIIISISKIISIRAVSFLILIMIAVGISLLINSVVVATIIMIILIIIHPFILSIESDDSTKIGITGLIILLIVFVFSYISISGEYYIYNRCARSYRHKSNQNCTTRYEYNELSKYIDNRIIGHIPISIYNQIYNQRDEIYHNYEYLCNNNYDCKMALINFIYLEE